MEQWLIVLPVLLFSVVVHECAHGIAAERAGDATARMMGRITLNPIPHIDPIGSILVPVLLIVSGSNVFFAWAKPVPVNPNNFNNPRRDDIAVSFAGPLSNLILALAFTLLMAGVIVAMPSSELGGEFAQVFRYAIWINLILAFFNLVPVPPLDGSHILENILPYEAARKYQSIRPYGFLILVGLIWFGLLSVFLVPARMIFNVLMTIVGVLVH